MTSEKPWQIVSLQTKTIDDFDTNIDRLSALIDAQPAHSIVVTPEVCLTAFPYDRMEEAVEAGERAREAVLARSDDKIVTLTYIAKEDDSYVNRSEVFYQKRCVHRQHKVKLFHPGNEHIHFKAGGEEEISLFEVAGIRFGLLVCFELRYPELWLKLRGADIVLNPSRWGLPRKAHYRVLTRALALANQCYVAAADSADPDMAASSAVIGPNGDAVEEDTSEVLVRDFDPKEIKRIRRYLNMNVSFD